jgi:hypothetical protein
MSRFLGILGRPARQTVVAVLSFFVLVGSHLQPYSSAFGQSTLPAPLLTEFQAVDWWFVFKFNATSHPGCPAGAKRSCIFGGDEQDYTRFSQRFIYASKGIPEPVNKNETARS